MEAAKEKEILEQQALPYKWNQQIHELNVTFEVPGNYKSKDIVIDIKRKHLKAGVKGQDPIIDVYSSPRKSVPLATTLTPYSRAKPPKTSTRPNQHGP